MMTNNKSEKKDSTYKHFCTSEVAKLNLVSKGINLHKATDDFSKTAIIT